MAEGSPGFKWNEMPSGKQRCIFCGKQPTVKEVRVASCIDDWVCCYDCWPRWLQDPREPKRLADARRSLADARSQQGV